MNESDRDVYVDLMTDQARTLRLPAHTRGWLSESWLSPSSGSWHLTVKDAACNEVASFPLTANHINLHVAADGSVELSGSERPFTRPLTEGEVQAEYLAEATCG